MAMLLASVWYYNVRLRDALKTTRTAEGRAQGLAQDRRPRT